MKQLIFLILVGTGIYFFGKFYVESHNSNLDKQQKEYTLAAKKCSQRADSILIHVIRPSQGYGGGKYLSGDTLGYWGLERERSQLCHRNYTKIINDLESYKL
jgi:hypothetical protein